MKSKNIKFVSYGTKEITHGHVPRPQDDTRAEDAYGNH